MKNYLYNLFAHLKNGQLAKRLFIYHLNKKSCKLFLKVLWDNGFIMGYKFSIKHPKILKIFLKYKKKNQPVINSLVLLSKPGRKIYYSAARIWTININKFFIIFSTNQGLKSISDCKKQKIGGEPFIKIS